MSWRGGLGRWFDESAAFNPVTPYGVSKVNVERAVSQLATDRFSPVEWEASQAEGMSYPAYRERQNIERGEKIPVQRVGIPQEIAPAVTFLASPAAAFITGHALDANGGVWMG